MVKENNLFSFYKRKDPNKDDVDKVEHEQGCVAPIGTSVPKPISDSVNDNVAVGPPLENQQEVEIVKNPIFQGLEHLERDLGKRAQIKDYSVNQREDVRRAYLVLGPMQPNLQKYKYSGPKGHQRSFQYNWFKKWPWLEYSETTGRAYCFNCFIFSDSLNSRSSDVFIVDGFDKWKKVNNRDRCDFALHEGSDPCSQHRNAVRACDDLLDQRRHVENTLKRQRDWEIERNCARLEVSIAAIKWLIFQACAFRGHRETQISSNQGNFIEIVKLLAEFNPNIASNVLENAPKNAKYTSPKIQKQIVSVFANLVRKYIRQEIGDSKFCIIVDETCDVSKKEQAALVIRFVDVDGVLQERFLDLIHVKNAKFVTLKEQLTSVLTKHSLSVQNIRGQGYDGGSNMRGELNGLQALFQKECPYAYYVHCYAHRLQLALVATAKEVASVSTFFFKLGIIINVVDSSAKRHDDLQVAQLNELARLLSIDELNTGRGLNQVGSLKRAGDTRWSSHFGSICSLMNMFNAISSVLEKISVDGDSGAIRAEADLAYGYLFGFEFVFVMCLMKEVLGYSNTLCKALQSEDQDIVTAVKLVTSTKSFLHNMRDEGWERFFGKVIAFCEAHEVQVPDMNSIYVVREGRARRQHDQFTNEHYFRVDIFLAFLDKQIYELNSRFSENVMDLLNVMSAFIPSNEFKSFDASEICRLVEKYYPEDFTMQEQISLEYQLQHFVFDLSGNIEMKEMKTMAALLQWLVKNKNDKVYVLIDRLLRLLITLPVSTSSAERAFSTLKIVKTRLRNKMGDKFLANCLVLNIERDIAKTIDTKSIIADFEALENRRVRFRT